MSAPVQFRLFASKFTLEDLKAGRQPIRNAAGEVHNVAILQFRYKQRLVIAGRGELQWSEWEGVPFVNEGEEAANQEPPAAA